MKALDWVQALSVLFTGTIGACGLMLFAPLAILHPDPNAWWIFGGGAVSAAGLLAGSVYLAMVQS